MAVDIIFQVWYSKIRNKKGKATQVEPFNIDGEPAPLNVRVIK